MLGCHKRIAPRPPWSSPHAADQSARSYAVGFVRCARFEIENQPTPKSHGRSSAGCRLCNCSGADCAHDKGSQKRRELARAELSTRSQQARCIIGSVRPSEARHNAFRLRLSTSSARAVAHSRLSSWHHQSGVGFCRSLSGRSLRHTLRPRRRLRPDRCSMWSSLTADHAICTTISSASRCQRAHIVAIQRGPPSRALAARGPSDCTARPTAPHRKAAVGKAGCQCAQRRRVLQNTWRSCLVYEHVVDAFRITRERSATRIRYRVLLFSPTVSTRCRPAGRFRPLANRAGTVAENNRVRALPASEGCIPSFLGKPRISISSASSVPRPMSTVMLLRLMSVAQRRWRRRYGARSIARRSVRVVHTANAGGHQRHPACHKAMSVSRLTLHASFASVRCDQQAANGAPVRFFRRHQKVGAMPGAKGDCLPDRFGPIRKTVGFDRSIGDRS